ncbi:LysR family transcriptional regulator [Pigmentiphaga aceris]|uniref:LysR family transcriptional regulator n=1 Tax=Pigmentiphaga aceris TaxID=1940612 RepID=A0A5C0AYK7_9BURK|nr:LysR substrate-binding domain-containing protein [Pigmentiphaga aceris]QEI05960.1 LysR family transcriptional regulator [Pigmentiphaga aceris]
MRLRQIEVFRAVMLMKTVSEAARYLHVSQPVVTRVLQHAEQELGFALFERGRGRMMPTPEALVLFEEANRVYGGIERLRKVAGHLRHHGAGVLRVAATPSLAQSVLTGAVQRFGQRHPDAGCRILSHHSHDILQGLLAHDFDLGFAINPPEHEAIRAEVVGHGRMVLAVPAGIAPPAGRPLHLDDFLGLPFIALDDESPLGMLVQQRLRDAGVDAVSRLEVQTYSLARALVESGAGVAIVDQNTAVSGAFDALTLYAIEPPLRFDVVMLRAAHRPSSVLSDSLGECLRDAQAKLDARLPQVIDSTPVAWEAAPRAASGLTQDE